MTELKTLKDIYGDMIELHGAEQGIRETHAAKIIDFMDDLKAEAVKWGKDILGEADDGGNLEEYHQGQLIFIKQFFNLTEADLQEGAK